MSFILLSLLAVAALTCSLAILLVGGSLLLAAMLPHGHPQVHRLREFASAAPKKAWRCAVLLDNVFWLGVVVLFVYLTFKYS